ncbi:hypothetical protein P5673_008101 [Acropora cervicornis]|uniref:Uncharacterized protein n=1 Tax=Acropora cervicornis TaxID=6130 RepID=A0AAD9QTV6_ACRCE|nr:hypothetical protein P5673_008101 [Acropora cervicornis]
MKLRWSKKKDFHKRNSKHDPVRIVEGRLAAHQARQMAAQKTAQEKQESLERALPELLGNDIAHTSSRSGQLGLREDSDTGNNVRQRRPINYCTRLVANPIVGVLRQSNNA